MFSLADYTDKFSYMYVCINSKISLTYSGLSCNIKYRFEEDEEKIL